MPEVIVNEKQQQVANKYKESLEKKGTPITPVETTPPPNKETPPPVTESKDKPAESQNAIATENKVEGEKKDAPEKTDTPVVDTEAQFRKRIKDELGLDLEDAKVKLSQKPLTDEEKKKQSQNEQKAVIDEYLSIDGNTIETYNQSQAEVAKSDMDLAKSIFFQANKEYFEDYTDEEKEDAFNDYYQLDTTKFSAKANKVGEKRIAKDAALIREAILKPIKEAEKSLQSKYSKKESTTKWERSVDEFVRAEGESLKTLKYKDEKHGEIVTQVPQEIFDAVIEKIKDTGKFATYLQNPDGTTNKKKLAEILIKAEMFDANNKLVAEGAYGKGVQDTKASFPPAPDFSNVGKQDNKVVEVKDLQKAANEYNKQQRNARK